MTIEAQARAENRSIANMIEVLLSEALAAQDKPVTKGTVQTDPVYVRSQVTTTRRAERSVDPHFKPDFK